jgi:hypothetical protein
MFTMIAGYFSHDNRVRKSRADVVMYDALSATANRALVLIPQSWCAISIMTFESEN